MKFAVLKRSEDGKTFIPIYKLPVLDWCKLTDKKAKLNSVVKKIVDVFKENMPPELSKSCPLSGRIEILNVNLYHKILMFAPNGIIQFTVHWYNRSNQTILWLSLLLKIEN